MIWQRRYHSICVFVFIFTVAVNYAEEPPSRAEFEAMKQRLSALEALVREQAVTIGRQQEALNHRKAESEALAHAVNTPEVPDRIAPGLPSWLDLSGVIEVEASWDDTAGVTTSDLVVATAALELGIDINDWLHGDIGVLYEEDETTALDLDIATVTMGNSEAFPVSLVVGKMYLPFGVFETNFVTDPLTLDLGETRETAAVVGAELGHLGLFAGVFNGDADNEDPGQRSHLDDYVLGASFTPDLSENTIVSLGVSYLSNLADSDTLQDELAVALLDDRVGAWSASAHLGYNRFGVIGEYLAATGNFADGELGFAPAGHTPDLRAWYIECYALITDKLVLAARYEQAHDTADLLPAERYGVAFSYELYATETVSAGLGLEYLHGRFDDSRDTRQDTVTLQLAIGF